MLQAILQFSRAVHINPAEKELWDEDLRWAHNLWLQKRQLTKQQAEETEKNEKTSSVSITELSNDSSQEKEIKQRWTERSHKLNDETIITSTSQSKLGASDKTDDDVIHLPSGYVKMRDVT